ncbi:hypothetical protein O181_027959 [Austropuccinia psidii MF-1]|uniref:Uncharacterized protein n=1 Tax=Austropuccinia psidii MF-1 TaxID=1389203 RepID=A0A9Q3H338_9BASI|nr:hypothetical protein [Austropuccinia psidii MF-1]
MGHMSEDEIKERIESTSWWPQWEKQLSEYINTYERFLNANRNRGKKLIGSNAVEVKLSDEFFRKHPVFPVIFIKPYHQTGEDKFLFRNNNHSPQDILELKESPGPVKKIIKARKIRLNGKGHRH